MGVWSGIVGNSRSIYGSHRWNPPGRLLVAALLAAATPLGLAAERQHIVFTRNAPTRSGLFLADADGKNEGPLLPATSLDYMRRFRGTASGSSSRPSAAVQPTATGCIQTAWDLSV
jgi:hypothetical protein